MGSNWHVGSQSIFGPIDGSSGGLFGNFYNINANNPGLSVWGKTWVASSVQNFIPSSSDPEGFQAAGGLMAVTGHWVQNSADKVGLLGIYGGTYLDLLSDYTAENASRLVKSGGNSSWATENIAWQTNVSRLAGVASKVIGYTGIALSSLSIGTKLFNGQTVKTSEYVGLAVAIGFAVASYYLAASVAAALAVGAVPAAATAATVVSVAAIAYGLGQFYSFSTTQKTIEQHIFND